MLDHKPMKPSSRWGRRLHILQAMEHATGGTAAWHGIFLYFFFFGHPLPRIMNSAKDDGHPSLHLQLGVTYSST